MKARNLYLWLKDQMPIKRFYKNFFITRHAWGAFHINSHISYRSKKPKVMYNTKATATKAAKSMEKKNGVHFSNYKCLHCDGYHIGKTRDNRAIQDAKQKGEENVIQTTTSSNSA